jgi:hypothetical protein
MAELRMSTVTRIVLAFSLLSLLIGKCIAQSPPVAGLTLPQAFAIFRPFDGTVTLPGRFNSPEIIDVIGTVDRPELRWVRVQIERISDGKFWDGFQWGGSPIFVSTILDSDQWRLPQVDLSVPSGYFFRISALSASGESFSPRSNGIYRIETIVDTNPPSGELNFPAANRIFSNAPPRLVELGDEVFSGFHPVTIQAQDEGVGVDRASVQIFQSSTRLFFDGSNWQRNPIWIPAIQTETGGRWQTKNEVDFSQLGDYLVRLNVQDFAGNVSRGSDNPRYEIKVIADTQAPTGILNNPRWEYFLTAAGNRVDGVSGFQAIAPGLEEVRGRATDDGTGVTQVRIQVQRSGNPPTFWNTDHYQTAPAWNLATLSETVAADQVRWTIGNVDFTGRGRYIIRISAIDNAGNRSRSLDNRRSFIRAQ